MVKHVDDKDTVDGGRLHGEVVRQQDLPERFNMLENPVMLLLPGFLGVGGLVKQRLDPPGGPLVPKLPFGNVCF